MLKVLILFLSAANLSLIIPKNPNYPPVRVDFLLDVYFRISVFFGLLGFSFRKLDDTKLGLLRSFVGCLPSLKLTFIAPENRLVEKKIPNLNTTILRLSWKPPIFQHGN